MHAGDGSDDAEIDLVRPYLVTQGRTRSRGAQLRFETLVTTSAVGRQVMGQQLFEQRQVLSHCSGPMSIAEVASKIDVPVGVARVLVGDLVADGLLDVTDAPTTDAQLVRRLIDGVRSL